MHPKTTSPPVDSGSYVEDYADILEKYDLDYKQLGYYYQVGEIEKIQGWILHLSSIWTETPTLLERLVPLLKSYDVPFKVVQGKVKACMICNGDLGYNKLGKVFCLYPPTDEEAVSLAKELLTITKDFQGCAIPTDFCLGGILHTRYGGFNPKLKYDDQGGVERYIYDTSGKLVKDEYTTPFKFPKGIPWPFQTIAAPVEEIPSTFLKDTYKVFSTIKNDAKGRVMKSLRMKGLKIEWILIKEAKHGVFSDGSARDNRDRLRWQYKLQNDLQDKIPVPKVYDFFEEKGNSYLVMEFIKGKLLGEVIANLLQSTVWFNLDANRQLLLVDYLLKLIDSISTLHKTGYVHRDISPMNFILNRKNEFVAIDLELSYSINENTPSPPFALGTPGFMSPEQQKVLSPATNQDIYNLGALMIMFFTNFNPVKFEQDQPRLLDDLNFFVRNTKLSKLIVKCLDQDPGNRPNIGDVKLSVENFRETLINSQQEEAPISRSSLNEYIEKIIDTLSGPVMASPGQPWFSNRINKNEQLVTPQATITFNKGLYSGVSGVMYVLAMAKSQGYSIGKTPGVYLKGLGNLETEFFSALPNVIPGLYYGAAGVALSLAKGIETGLIDIEHQPMIEKCLDLQIADKFDVAHGMAGQGLAALSCGSLLAQQTKDQVLQRCIEAILANQQRDGSWLTTPGGNQRPMKYTGFSQGVAGICYFLLKYYEDYKDEKVIPTLLKGLLWLRKNAKKNKKGLIHWFTQDSKKEFKYWLSDGNAGVILTLIRAYEILRDPAYGELAEEALNGYPPYLVDSNLSWANGMVGLAETYLIAADTFKSEKWRERADFIIDMLIHTSKGRDQSRYWIIENNVIPTADFMIGNSGILHLFLKYDSPKMSSFL